MVIYKMLFRGCYREVKTEMLRQRERETNRVQFRMDNQTVRSELRM